MCHPNLVLGTLGLECCLFPLEAKKWIQCVFVIIFFYWGYGSYLLCISYWNFALFDFFRVVIVKQWQKNLHDWMQVELEVDEDEWLIFIVAPNIQFERRSKHGGSHVGYSAIVLKKPKLWAWSHMAILFLWWTNLWWPLLQVCHKMRHGLFPCIMDFGSHDFYFQQKNNFCGISNLFSI